MVLMAEEATFTENALKILKLQAEGLNWLYSDYI
jgi:hypothetical protein